MRPSPMRTSGWTPGALLLCVKVSEGAKPRITWGPVALSLQKKEVPNMSVTMV